MRNFHKATKWQSEGTQKSVFSYLQSLLEERGEINFSFFLTHTYTHIIDSYVFQETLVYYMFTTYIA